MSWNLLRAVASICVSIDGYLHTVNRQPHVFQNYTLFPVSHTYHTSPAVFLPDSCWTAATGSQNPLFVKGCFFLRCIAHHKHIEQRVFAVTAKRQRRDKTTYSKLLSVNRVKDLRVKYKQCWDFSYLAKLLLLYYSFWSSYTLISQFHL